VELLEFTPENDLEKAIEEARRGALSLADLVKVVVRLNLYISSLNEVQRDGGGFEPLLLEQNGKPLVAVFSSLSRPGLHRHMAEYVLQMNGREFFLRIPPNYGVILNPGYAAQVIIPSDGVFDLRKDLAVESTP
jgi:hypothetical protein